MTEALLDGIPHDLPRNRYQQPAKNVKTSSAPFWDTMLDYSRATSQNITNLPRRHRLSYQSKRPIWLDYGLEGLFARNSEMLLPRAFELMFRRTPRPISPQETNSVQTPPHHAPPRVQIQRLMWLDQGLQLKQRHYLAYTLFAVHRPMLGDGTCKFSTLIANSTTSVASYSTHGPYEWNGCEFTGGGSYISQENGQTPPFAVDVGFRPDFGRRSVVLSPQYAKSGSPPTSRSTYGPNRKIEHAYLGGGSYISQDNGQTPPFAADVGFRPDF